MITDYVVLTDYTEYGLRAKVLAYLQLGWEPLGGISFSVDRVGVQMYVQAVIKKTTDGIGSGKNT